MEWIPSVLVGRIFRLSLTPNASLGHYGPASLVIIAVTLALLAGVAWLVRRTDGR
jgi:branched-subunit amino acid ABC-type transport system permease component